LGRDGGKALTTRDKGKWFKKTNVEGQGGTLIAEKDDTHTGGKENGAKHSAPPTDGHRSQKTGMIPAQLALCGILKHL